MKKRAMSFGFILFWFILFSIQAFGVEEHGIMRFSDEMLKDVIHEYATAPKAAIVKSIPITKGNFSLLPYLNYVPADRNQGYCGDCWVWAGTGCIEIALTVQSSNFIFDRLSTQFLNSCYNNGTGSNWACCGGTSNSFSNFYNSTQKALPWNNAAFQDGNQQCNNSTSLACSSISTTPYYAISSISSYEISTIGAGNPVGNIKNVLNQNKAIFYTVFLPNGTAWNNFYNFWSFQNEDSLWDPSVYDGDNYDSNTGGGHAMLLVGYNDDVPSNSYWIIVNSWGKNNNRPNGILHLKMGTNYDAKLNWGGYDLYIQEFYTFNIDYNLAGQAENDTCANAKNIYGNQFPYTDNGNTVLANDLLSCPCNNSGGAECFYKLNNPPHSSINVSVTSDEIDPVIAVWNGNCSSLTPLHCSNSSRSTNSASVTFQNTGDNPYFITVEGKDGVKGVYALTVDYAQPVPTLSVLSFILLLLVISALFIKHSTRPRLMVEPVPKKGNLGSSVF